MRKISIDHILLKGYEYGYNIDFIKSWHRDDWDTTSDIEMRIEKLKKPWIY
jgi:hypothetical protein